MKRNFKTIYFYIVYMLQEYVPMKNLISFRAGGAAKFFAEVNSIAEINQAMQFAKENALSVFILGNGTNVLVSDAGFDGLILKLGASFKHMETQIKEDSLTVKAGAAITLGTLSRRTINLGFGGIHLLAGVPGTLGGAVFMNAGAYGQEISNCIESVEVYTKNATIETRSKDECGFNYRTSNFQKGNPFEHDIILSCTLQLPKGDLNLLKQETETVMKSRREKQPLEKPNAGSAFKRVPVGFPGALIEQAGLKGYRIGDAQVSEKHANFIVNLGNATAKDIESLFTYVEREVQKKTGVTLEREVIFLGF